ncbi:lipopolysaccharide biosynthesis protein [Aeromonas jandaei]|uniref:lipopolysaccharide biosynthesis protein n=1 Tax=Aeromonas jandaei TaxID=650 RepID=UPI0038B4A882
MILPKSKYARNVITLMSGTGLAQAIPIAISPILTRLYSPEEFGMFALYLAMAAILSVGATGRYELAILLPKKDSDAMNILALSVFLSFIVSLLFLVVIFAFNYEMTSFLNTPEISAWLYWVPASTLLMGIYQSLNYWSNRKSHYKRLAISRSIQSGASAVTQLGAGYIGASIGGLIGSQLVGQVVSSAVLSQQIVHEDKLYFRKIRKKRMLLMARRYQNFPRFLILAHGFNTASAQIPVMFLTVFFSTSIAGFYMLTQRVMGVPTTLIASAIGDVFRQEATHAYIHSGNCRDIYISTFKMLLFLSLPPSLVFIFIAPDLFAFAFGDTWRDAGIYAQILTPVFFLRFVTTPLSNMFMIAEKQKLDLVWQIGLLSMTFFSLLIGKYAASAYLAIILFATSYSAMFIINGLMTYRMATGREI